MIDSWATLTTESYRCMSRNLIPRCVYFFKLPKGAELRRPALFMSAVQPHRVVSSPPHLLETALWGDVRWWRCTVKQRQTACWSPALSTATATDTVWHNGQVAQNQRHAVSTVALNCATVLCMHADSHWSGPAPSLLPDSHPSCWSPCRLCHRSLYRWSPLCPSYPMGRPDSPRRSCWTCKDTIHTVTSWRVNTISAGKKKT